MTGAGVEAFARKHGLEPATGGAVRALTPMLIAGRGGSMTTLLRGQFAPGLDGQLIHHLYADGDDHRASTILLGQVPESTAFAPALVCRDRETAGEMPAQLPAERWRETKLESSAFNERYRLLTLVGQHEGWMRELFSPRLVDWLTEEAPAGLSFELNQGNLAVSLPGKLETEDELELLASTAAELARRIHREAMEEDADPDLFDESAEIAAIEAVLPAVTWDRSPESVQEAVAAYRNIAAGKPAVLAKAALVALIAAAVVGALVAVIFSAPAGVLVGAVLVIAIFPIARLVAAARYRWGTASVDRVGEEAFVREYARSRNLKLRDRWRFQSQHRTLPLPGFADHVLAGEILGADLEGLFVMFSDDAEMRSQGIEVAFTSDRPLASNALVVDLAAPVSDEAIAAVELPPDYRVECSESQLVVWRPVAGNLLRTAEGSDRFRTRAGEVVRRLIFGTRLSP